MAKKMSSQNLKLGEIASSFYPISGHHDLEFPSEVRWVNTLLSPRVQGKKNEAWGMSSQIAGFWMRLWRQYERIRCAGGIITVIAQPGLPAGTHFIRLDFRRLHFNTSHWLRELSLLTEAHPTPVKHPIMHLGNHGRHNAGIILA